MKEDEIMPNANDLPMYMMPHQISGLRTGYYELNKLLSGWQNYEYVIVGYSKPEDANEFISNNADVINRFGGKVAIVSPNMATSYSNIDYKKTIVLHDCDSIFDLRKRVRRLVWENGIRALIIDDITKLNCPEVKFKSKESELGCISRNLCQFTREIDIPVISFVPVNPNSEVPQLSLLIPIGYLDQDADVVIFLKRDECNKLTPLVAKNRSGGISTIYKMR